MLQTTRIGLITVVIAALATTSAAAVPNQMNFQGLLTDDQGHPATTGIYSVKFRIYDAATEGNELWSSDGFRPLPVEDGLFNHILGSSRPLPDSLTKYDSLWLGVTSDSDPEMTPRTMLVSVMYAMKARVADIGGGWFDDGSTVRLQDSTNYVGIGTTPSTPLHIKQSSAETGANNGILIDQAGAGDAALSVRLPGTEQFVMGIDNSDEDKFKIADGADFGTARLAIDIEGNVGIGTTIPDEKLTVSGNAHVTGDLRVEGSITPSIGWRHSGTQVFSGSTPSAWTDLDLSGIVGTNYALVLMKVKGASGSSTHVFRPNGDTDEYWRCNDLTDMGAQGHKGECAEAGVVVAETDGNGIVEWRGQGTNVTLTLLGYIR